MAMTVKRIELSPKTLEAFNAYVGRVESEMDETEKGSSSFLWSDLNDDRTHELKSGKVVAQFWPGPGPVKVPNGLIHDWIAAAFIPDFTTQGVLAVIQDYNNHKNIYKPEVIDSRLIMRTGNDFQIYLRLLKKKVITVVLDSDHDVHYRPVAPTRWTCRSYTTRIAEVENAGRSDERISEPDTGYGFLWRLYSYWRFEEREGGVVVECRAISLTRDVPFGLGWAIEPIIQKLPKESLIKTLEATRQALYGKAVHLPSEEK
jgi:hypothetical protein